MDYINRILEKKILNAQRDFKVVLVTGAKQTGKSTMFKKIFPDKKYVTFDDPFIEEQAKESTDMFMALNQPPVIFDEVQRVPELFRYIKVKCDESDERGLFYLSGSQPFRLMEDVSESLLGRVCIIELSAVQDLDAFRRFMIAVAARTGQMVNYSNIAAEISRDVGTVKNWISILEASGYISCGSNERCYV